MCPVQQHVAPVGIDQLQPSRPARGKEAGSAGVQRRCRDPDRREGVERRIGHGRVGRLVAPAQTDSCGAHRVQVHHDAVAVQAQHWGLAYLPQVYSEAAGPAAHDRKALALRTRYRLVAAHDDGRLLAGDQRDRGSQPVHVIQLDVGDDRHAAVPRVRRIQTSAEAHLDESDVDALLREPAEDHGGQQLEFCRLTEARGYPRGDREHSGDQAREVPGRDRVTVDLCPLAIADQMRLGSLAHSETAGPQGRAGERDDTALAIGAGHQRPAEPELRIVEGTQQRARAGKTEAHAEPAPLLKGSNGCRVGQGRHAGGPAPNPARSRALSSWSGRPRRRRTG